VNHPVDRIRDEVPDSCQGRGQGGLLFQLHMHMVIMPHRVASMQMNLLTGEMQPFFEMRLEIERTYAFVFNEAMDHIPRPWLIKNISLR
jgi:hypothetical protein